MNEQARTDAPAKIAIGSDHRGVPLKARITAWIESLGRTVVDCGAHSVDSCDYPDIAHPLAARVEAGEVDCGILICGTGIGMSMAANKHAGIRAALCHELNGATMSRRHNDANVLCLSADLIEALPESTARELIETWLTTPFDGGRHARRVSKIPMGRTAEADSTSSSPS